MGIRMRETPEALSDQSLASPAEGTLNHAVSAAGTILQQELLRYCAGQINGRSFLIAGHRGAGKTTSVNAAIDAVLRRLRTDAETGVMRPLPVFVHGPSLFEPEEVAAAKTSADGASPAASGNGAAAAARTEQTKVALVHIILGLHRAAVRELVRCYRRKLLGHAEARRSLGPAGVELAREMAELAAQFEIEILEDPTAARLREFWALASAMEAGVLFHPHPTEAQDQGWRELVALNGLCNAHQRISGDISAKDQVGRSAAAEQTSTRTFEVKGMELLKPFAAVLAGVAVAGAGALGSGDVPTSGAAGLLAALLAALAFKSSTTSTEKRSRQIDTTFIPDLSLKTLDRVLPNLLVWLRRAGLAPVLVIDELDKVPDLPARFQEMAHFLKKLMAEDVFTCFLTDRGYLEHLRVTGHGTAYGLAYSYFSHPLLVAFTPEDIDRYVRALLIVDAPHTPTPAGTAPMSSPDLLDIQVLPWVLRHRSRLHALALARELAAIRGDGGQVLLRTGAVRSDSLFRIDVTLQVALELQLKSKQTQGWTRQRPDMLQVLNDTLYFLTREWIEGADMLNLGAAGRQRVKEKLCARMNLEPGKPASGAEAPSALGAHDLDLLFGIVEGMVSFLGQDNTKLSADRTWTEANRALELAPDDCPLAQPVLDALLLGEESLLYAVPTGSSESFRWRYLPSGNLRPPEKRADADVPQGPPIAAALRAVEAIRSVDATLRAVFEAADAFPLQVAPLEFLADRLLVLPTSPAWSRVEPAMRNLELAREGRGIASSLPGDCRQALGFEANLNASRAVLVAFLRTAAFLAAFRRDGERARDLVHSMQTLSNALRFSRLGVERVGKALAEFGQQLRQLPELPALGAWLGESAVDVAFDATALDGMIAASRKAGEAVQAALDWSVLNRHAWTDARVRALALRYGQAARAVTAAEVLCATVQSGPGAFGLLDLETVSLARWSDTLLRCLKPGTGKGGTVDLPPPWLAALALRRLGAAALDAGTLRQLRSELGLLSVKADPEDAAAVEQLFSAEGNSRRVAVLLSADVSYADFWTEPPSTGLLIAATQDTWPDVQVALQLISPGTPVLMVLEEKGWMDEPDFVAAAGALSKLRAAEVQTAHVYERKRRSMRVPSIIDPQGPDDVLAYVNSPA